MREVSGTILAYIDVSGIDPDQTDAAGLLGVITDGHLKGEWFDLYPWDGEAMFARVEWYR